MLYLKGGAQAMLAVRQCLAFMLADEQDGGRLLESFTEPIPVRKRHSAQLSLMGTAQIKIDYAEPTRMKQQVASPQRMFDIPLAANPHYSIKSYSSC